VVEKISGLFRGGTNYGLNCLSKVTFVFEKEMTARNGKNPVETSSYLEGADVNGTGNRKILIAVTGVSPAILTETVWALAQEEPSWIPDQVVAITTRTGKVVIEKLLLDGGGWGQLRAVLAKKGAPVDGALAFGSSDSIRVIGDGSRDFDDISTPEESGAAEYPEKFQP